MKIANPAYLRSLPTCFQRYSMLESLSQSIWAHYRNFAKVILIGAKIWQLWWHCKHVILHIKRKLFGIASPYSKSWCTIRWRTFSINWIWKQTSTLIFYLPQRFTQAKSPGNKFQTVSLPFFFLGEKIISYILHIFLYTMNF